MEDVFASCCGTGWTGLQRTILLALSTPQQTLTMSTQRLSFIIRHTMGLAAKLVFVITGVGREDDLCSIQVLEVMLMPTPTLAASRSSRRQLSSEQGFRDLLTSLLTVER